MTRKEAIYILKEIEYPTNGDNKEERDIAFDVAIKALEQEPKTGRWERMSDLSNDVDDRFKCSRCGNIVHYNNVMYLRTFSRWCGRCGSDNG